MRFTILVLGCLVASLPVTCSAQSLEDAVGLHDLEVKAATEMVNQEWQKILASSLAKNEQKEAGEHREWSEWFRTEGAMFMPTGKAEMASIYKAYGSAIKLSGDKLRTAYLAEVAKLQHAGNSGDADLLLAELTELRLPGKLMSLQPYRSTLWVNHWGYQFRASTVKEPGLKMNATLEMTSGLSSPGLHSMRACNFPKRYLGHLNFRLRLTDEVADDSGKLLATWLQVSGLGNEKTGVSFQAVTHPDRYIRMRSNGELWLDKFEETPQFRKEATFIIKPALFALWPSDENADGK